MPLTDSELTFIKFAGYLLILLWIMYLVRENFFPHKDSRIDALNSSIQTMSATVASQATQMAAIERRQTELITQQKEDVRLLFAEIKGMNESIQTVLRDHEHDIATAATGGRKPR